MPFFMNPFDADYKRSWLNADDRSLQPNFKVPANKNADPIVAWNVEPYNCSGNTSLNINFAFDPTLKQWASRDITISGANLSAISASEAATSLNADPFFSTLFTATATSYAQGGGQPYVQSQYGTQYQTQGTTPNTVMIRCKRGKQATRLYVANSGAETAFNFNLKAGINQLPSYCMRDTITNVNNYPDSLGMLIYLSTSSGEVGGPMSVINQNIINGAGFNWQSGWSDWQFAQGSCSFYTFHNYAYDTSGRLHMDIAYPAGANIGDLATKTTYVYASNTASPTQVTAYPYTLLSGDLVTPTSG